MSSMEPMSTLKPAEVAVVMVEFAIAKHQTRPDKVFIKAFIAGIMLSFGGLISEVIQGGSPAMNTANPGLLKVLGGFVFPVGLVMIVLGGYELLTSNMMVFPMACLKRAVPWWGLALNWIVVTFGNLVGSLFFAAIITKYSGIISTPPYNTFAVTFALHKAKEPEWHEIFLRGIGCNWLVCVAVWQAAGARDTLSKIVATWFPIWVFVSCGFDHVIANMFSVPLGIMFGADLTVAEYIRKSLIASYLGNIVGALFVGLPALYMYLQHYDFTDTQMKELEAGQASQTQTENEASGASSAYGKELPTPTHPAATEVYEISSKRS